MKYTELKKDSEKGINIFLLVVVSTVILLAINVFFYQTVKKIDYFELFANSILLLTTFYLIYVTQKNSINKSGFYYYTSIGFAFVFFGLFVLTLDYVFIYVDMAVKISTKLLFVSGYSLLAIGVTKWIKYNESRQDELSLQANTDELTGILNRRSFTGFVEYEFIKAKTHSEPFSLIIIDIDLFKSVNDNHGHLVGDEVIKRVANILSTSFRSADRICRWGGEEFAVLLPSTSLKNAMTVAEKIRQKVELQSYSYGSVLVKYTISLGVSESLTSDKNIDDIIGRADEGLYLAKNNNRNCVHSVRA
jgi:diguanylate cyclase (GGDEF)-like protein